MLPDQRLTLRSRRAVTLRDPLFSIPFTPILLIVLNLVSRSGIVRRDGTLAHGCCAPITARCPGWNVRFRK